MPPNQLIKSRRIELGLEEVDLANQAGLSAQEYADIEQYPNELATVTDLSRAKRLCSALQLSISTVLRPSDKYSNETVVSRAAQTLAEARVSKGLTVEQLADDLGIERWVVEQIEDNEAAIERWPFEFVANYARSLGLPISRFLA